jgi:type II secretory pathway pseudopilin PulG
MRRPVPQPKALPSHRFRHPRAGITLTEILIAIMIMAIGMTSLATLFPIGLDRIRNAQRMIRSTQLSTAARSDLLARGLLREEAFRSNVWCPQYPGAGYALPRNPWVLDQRIPGSTGPEPARARVEGLPVAFDPLWWAMVYSTSGLLPDGSTHPDGSTPFEGRFGADVTGSLRADPDGGTASAYGLQRLTTLQFLSFDPKVPASYNVDAAAAVFTTPDDPVMLGEGPLVADGSGSLLGSETGNTTLPMLDSNSSYQPLYDWTYTWMFTGKRLGLNDLTYSGDIVVFHNRPLSVDTVGTKFAPSGERVVEAIFSYGTTVNKFVTASTGYSPQDRTVLIRWPSSQPDPTIKIGSFIADVTYERYLATDISRTLATYDRYPGQRCHWYRVSRKTEAEDDPDVTGHRRMILTTDERVLSRTLLWYGDASHKDGDPVHLNAALINPYVVNVLRNQVILAK